MTTLSTESLPIFGVLVNDENPQPYFATRPQNLQLVHDGTLHTHELVRYGTNSDLRILPYRMQDRYSRNKRDIALKSIVLENEFLKAVFLPEHGGKLWSLYAKQEQRELLFKNPVFQPANLANRNAWTAGGIEWNLGHLGHCAFTADSVFCAQCNTPQGETFLRIYEYEATHAQLMQLDFHLPSGARQLVMHATLTNLRAQESPLYWWTNTAITLTPHTRIFSGTDDILYQLTPEGEAKLPGFGRCKMPVQPNIQCADISYPWRIPRSVEYFFQNSATEPAPWEASIEADGTGFFERSTQPLFARKMFCWGTGVGGRHWCDYLSREGEGNYVEIQAGLAPTQNHTTILPALGSVCFTQVFGAFCAQSRAQTQAWGEAMPTVAQVVEETLSAAAVQTLHTQCAVQANLAAQCVLHTGSHYGMLENARRAVAGEPPMAAHLDFSVTTDAVDAWVGVLQGTPLPESQVPLPYCTDIFWEPYLCAVAEQSGQSALQYAVLLAENGREKTARSILKRLSQQGNAYATHALGALCRRAGEAEVAATNFMVAYEQAGKHADSSFAESALQALLVLNQYETAWQLFDGIPVKERSETQCLLACEAATKTGHWAFLEKAFAQDFALIREGALGLSEIWVEYRARLSAAEKGIHFAPEQIDRTVPLPRHLDFRMI